MLWRTAFGGRSAGPGASYGRPHVQGCFASLRDGRRIAPATTSPQRERIRRPPLIVSLLARDLLATWEHWSARDTLTLDTATTEPAPNSSHSRAAGSGRPSTPPDAPAPPGTRSLPHWTPAPSRPGATTSPPSSSTSATGSATSPPTARSCRRCAAELTSLCQPRRRLRRRAGHGLPALASAPLRQAGAEPTNRSRRSDGPGGLVRGENIKWVRAPRRRHSGFPATRLSSCAGVGRAMARVAPAWPRRRGRTRRAPATSVRHRVGAEGSTAVEALVGTTSRSRAEGCAGSCSTVCWAVRAVATTSVVFAVAPVFGFGPNWGNRWRRPRGGCGRPDGIGSSWAGPPSRAR